MTNLIFEIRKEKLIEEVEAQQKDGTFDNLAKELKDLQDLGCNKEFNNLMDYLKETEHDGLNEAVYRRFEIFNKIRKQITFQYPINKNESAQFYMLQFTSNKDVVDILNEKIKNSEIFIRYMIIAVNKDDVKVKSSNGSINKDDDDVIFDRRFAGVIEDVFNLK